MLKKILMATFCTGVVVACAQSPTGRDQLLLFNDSELSKMGAQTFEGMKAETPISKDARTNTYVQCVAENLLQVTPEKFMGNGWEIVVFDSEQVNAFALPGGKIGVYTGLLKVAENQHQLAAVVGHEIGHVMAGHSNERLSTNTGIAVGGAAINAVLGAYSVQYKEHIMAALGVGAQVGIELPFSRTHESEADIIGLQLMAQAGFNPEQAVNLWQNMAAAGGGKRVPEWQSTHPAPENRIKKLQLDMPAALQLYNQRKAAAKLPDCGSL
ncbi:M48 family metallopeptidase [Chromatiaceae bacterium AAb-1]|jgi:predicted Zn-dependent protease|nr:M48 family metallopeptidase [Chromatiaceae bacterium AAb-1]